MPPSKQDTSRENIEPEINKAFEKVEKIKNPTMADILHALNLGFLRNENYRMIDFSYTTLCKCLIFKELKGIRFQTELVRYLKTHKRERKKLGLKRTPDQTTISYFINHVLDKDTKEIIKYITGMIKKKIKETGLPIDFGAFIINSGKNRVVVNNQLRTIKSKEIAEFFKNKTLQMMKFKKRHNTKYLEKELIDLLVETGLSKKCAENISIALKCRGRNTPSADTLLRRIKKFSREEIIKNFDVLQENLWVTVRRNRFYSSGVKAIIDFTDWNFNGKHTNMTIGKLSPTGNKIKCFRFGTMDILDKEGCYTLKALPINPLTAKENILYRLLLEGKKKVKIKIALVDRGFFNEKCINVFDELNIQYLMPVIRNEKIKKIEEQTPTPFIIKDVEMKSAKYNLIIVKQRFSQGTNSHI